jgi:hypothetical protein
MNFLVPYRAIFIVIDTPQALEDNLALIETCAATT